MTIFGPIERTEDVGLWLGLHSFKVQLKDLDGTRASGACRDIYLLADVVLVWFTFVNKYLHERRLEHNEMETNPRDFVVSKKTCVGEQHHRICIRVSLAVV